MANHVHTENENIRKIEDIIDIQKANGNLCVRQVAFNLPSDNENTTPNSARSLESGLSKKSKASKKKKVRSKRRKSPLFDAISWPSDSDITVLRMKLCLDGSLKEKDANIPGDGLHRPDSSSMVNLATLMRQSQTTSKHSINIEEYLLPITSWELQDQDEEKAKINNVEAKTSEEVTRDNRDRVCMNVTRRSEEEGVKIKDCEEPSNSNAKTKMARFLRLYFCPCCTCLYNIEKMKDKPSAYSTNRRN